VGAVHPITEIRVLISQADLADFVGATCEGVTMIPAEWRALGWVAQSRGTLRIVDHPAPDAVAHADIN
jgi:CRP-like cAMP-binding protein